MNLKEFLGNCRADQNLIVMRNDKMIKADLYAIYTSPLAKLLQVDEAIINHHNVLITVK